MSSLKLEIKKEQPATAMSGGGSGWVSVNYSLDNPTGMLL